MAKNIVILFDGTGNQIKERRTNVLRLYGCLEKSDDQVVWYDPGVGTFGAEGSWSRLRQKASEIFGMATGLGLDGNVKEAYRFLCQTYDHEAGDRIWIMGFSRGAYTARVLAGFLHAFGMMSPVQLNLLGYVYRAYKNIGRQRGEDAFAEIRLHDRALNPQKVQIAGLMLLDTVASVIEPRGLLPGAVTYAYTSNNPSVLAVRHAVAIDERRRMYRATLWGEDCEVRKPFTEPGTGTPQDVKEMWFAGAHGDVGGGYPEAESQLGKLPLSWMITESRKLGLKYVTRTVNRLVLGSHKNTKYVAPDATADAHESLTAGWWPFELVPGRDRAAPGKRFLGLTWPLGAYRKIPEGAQLHPSVQTRLKERSSYRPPNLP